MVINPNLKENILLRKTGNALKEIKELAQTGLDKVTSAIKPATESIIKSDEKTESIISKDKKTIQLIQNSAENGYMD